MRLFVVLDLLGVAALLLSGQALAQTPKPVHVPVVNVVLGTPFTLKKAERAQLTGQPVFVEIESFVNSPCPKGAQCGWSGLAVYTKVIVNAKPCVGTPPRAECVYEIDVRESDYKTWATLVLHDVVAECEAKAPDLKQGCLRKLSVRFADETFCGKLRDVPMKDGCYEDLAEQPGRAALCDKTTAPTQYCLYTRLVANNGLARCEEIIKFPWRVRCFKELAAKSGKGAEICDTLAGNLPGKCREYLLGGDH